MLLSDTRARKDEKEEKRGGRIKEVEKEIEKGERKEVEKDIQKKGGEREGKEEG